MSIHNKTVAAAVLSVSFLVTCAHAAAPTLSVGTASGQPGTTVSLPISFDPGTNSVAGLQFSLTLPAGLSTGAVTAASMLDSAGKSVSANLSGGVWTFVIFGLNQTALPAGSLLTAQLAIAPGTPAASLAVAISAAVYSDPNGTSIAGGASAAGAVTVNSPVAIAVPPKLTNIGASTILNEGATIKWKTNVPADSQVEYGLTSAYGLSTALNTALVMSHSAVLSGLSSGRTYHYRVKSRDAMGNLAVSIDKTFKTRAIRLRLALTGVRVQTGLENLVSVIGDEDQTSFTRSRKLTLSLAKNEVLQLSGEAASMVIFDLAGRQITSFEGNGTFDPELKPGKYLVQVYDNNGKASVLPLTVTR